MLPETREAFELYLESFQNRRAAYPQVLIAQRNYFQASLEYVEALSTLRRAEVAIRGLLLVDGLDEPPGPGEGRGGGRAIEPRLRVGGLSEPAEGLFLRDPEETLGRR